MAKHHPPSVAWKGFGNPGSGWASRKHWNKTIRLGIGQAIPEVDWNWVRVHPTRLASGSSIGAPEPGGSSASQRCFGGFHGLVPQGLANGPSSQGQGVPLEGPFLGVFFTGEFDRNERNACFSRFSHVLHFYPTSLGSFNPLRWVV